MGKENASCLMSVLVSYIIYIIENQKSSKDVVYSI